MGEVRINMQAVIVFFATSHLYDKLLLANKVVESTV